ncbi:hypothetical protein [Streptomyces sp. AHA2]
MCCLPPRWRSGSLDSGIEGRGRGKEKQAVAAWLERHPEMVDRMAPQ